MDAGEKKAAADAEARRGELDLSQTATGVDPKTWREFVAGKTWPRATSRGKIESSLGLRMGALHRIAHGGSTLQDEIDAEPAATALVEIPAELGQMQALLNELTAHYQDGQYGLVNLKLHLLQDLLTQLIEPDERATGT